MNLAFGPEPTPPDRELVLRQLGFPAGTPLPARHQRLYDDALALYAAHAAPAGVLAEISRDEFRRVYEGEGKNAADGPVAAIAPQAEELALFAVTLGADLGDVLAHCFTDGDFALAYTLDAMASVGADQAAEEAERQFAATLRAGGWATPDGVALRYSPGYCGWDVSGQRRLFAFLKPGSIGLTLTNSCLMQPLKSVSGVILAGPKTIHRFTPAYDFCAECEDRTCRKRWHALARRAADVV